MVPHGIVYVQATFNNTIVTITDPNGRAVCWASAGSIGFKGSRKGTPYAAQMAAEACARKASEVGMRAVVAYVKGPGGGRESAVRALLAANRQISPVWDHSAFELEARHSAKAAHHPLPGEFFGRVWLLSF